VRIETPSHAAIASVLAGLRDVILRGSFVHTSSKDDCQFCDYSAACDQSLEARAEGKLEDATLQPYLRLTEHA
jgi:hypothetical protein